MNRIIRLLCAFLSAALVIASLCCCTTKESQNTQAANNSSDSSVEVTLPVIADGTSKYTIISPASEKTDANKLYVGFKSFIAEKTGVDLAIKNDETEEGEYEILIGKTNRSASDDAYALLSENQFSFSVSGSKIIISAYDSDCMSLALDKFIELFVENGSLSINTASFPITYQCKDEISTVKIKNTRNIRGDDPYFVEHDGSYYYCWSDGGINVAKINSLDNITKNTRNKGKCVFSGSNGYGQIWAPELHYIDGEWYIYVAMTKGSDNNEDHRMYCLKGSSQDPTKPFEVIGQVTDKTNKWAIDGTVFTYNDELYTVWSGWEGNNNVSQKLYIAHMSNPWTIDSKRVLISEPTTWDAYTQGPSVNEGPCALIVDGKLFILYSGNGSWTDDYCIGYVSLDGDDPLDSNSWNKSRTPILSKNEKAYGPGHCSLFKAEDGSYWIAYHANLESGTGWSGRSMRIQPLTFKNGKPAVSKPMLEVDIPKAKKVIEGEVN